MQPYWRGDLTSEVTINQGSTVYDDQTYVLLSREGNSAESAVVRNVEKLYFARRGYFEVGCSRNCTVLYVYRMSELYIAYNNILHLIYWP